MRKTEFKLHRDDQGRWGLELLPGQIRWFRTEALFREFLKNRGFIAIE